LTTNKEAMKRLILRPGLLLAGLLTVFAINIQAQDLNSAITLTRSEQYDKADAMFQQLIKNEPGNSKNYFYYGENYLSDYFADTISNSLTVMAKSAREIYQKGVEANSNDPLNYIGLAKVAYFLGDNKTATEMRTKARSFLLPYKNIKKISPPAKDYAYALGKIAESYIKDGAVDTSVTLPLIREAIKIDNKNRDVYLIAGDIYILVNDGSKAIMYYNQAQFADPKSPTAEMKIGNIYVKGKALQVAIPHFEQAIQLNASYAPAYREMGQLYLLAQNFNKSKEYFKQYLDLTAGNIPAKTRYVNALFYAKDYEGVIKNVEEIFQVDQSRTYMNRIAGYSCYEKNPPDYNKALSYMETLFKTVAPERIIQKDYHYLARILIKKNQNFNKMTEELNGLKVQLENSKAKYASVNAAEKAKLKPALDELTAKTASLEKDVAASNAEINRAFGEYNKMLVNTPDDKNLLNEMASNYYSLKRYEGAAKTWSKLLDPSKDNTEDLMRIGRAYYNGEKYNTADSVFNVVAGKNPGYIPAYTWIANTYTKMDPDTKLGLAKPKFEKLIQVAAVDSLKNASVLMDAFKYLSYYHMVNDNYSSSKDYYLRMVNLDASNKDYKIAGYNGLGTLDYRMAGTEKTIEGRLPYLAKSEDSYSKALALDPNNTAAKNMLKVVQDFKALVIKGINPNEIKGSIKNAAGQPVPYVSVRVKDTAAETMSNPKGEFKFEIPQSSEALIISLKGYKTQEIPITKSRIYNVILLQ
jgi:tetratricopeptide (TPR) repeat protein